MEKFSIEVHSLPPIHKIGQKVYVIREESLGSGRFRVKCPVCDDEKKIAYRGYDLPCPYCSEKKQYGWDKDPIINSISLKGYTVVEYIVNSITIEGSDTMDAYKPRNAAKRPPRIMKVGAFHRYDGGWHSVDTVSVPNSVGIDLDPTEEWLGKDGVRVGSFAFTTKKKAQEAAEFFTEKEKKRLAEFNKKFGCNFEYPVK